MHGAVGWAKAHALTLCAGLPLVRRAHAVVSTLSQKRVGTAYESLSECRGGASAFAHPTRSPEALPPQRLRHDLLAALAVLGIGHAGVAAEGGLEAVRRMSGHAPAARAHRELAPVFGVVGHVGRLVDLLDLGGVFHHEAVRLDEIGEHIVARAVAADAPFAVEAGALEPAGATHQAVK